MPSQFEKQKCRLIPLRGKRHQWGIVVPLEARGNGQITKPTGFDMVLGVRGMVSVTPQTLREAEVDFDYEDTFPDQFVV